jgi:hypothetical protein
LITYPIRIIRQLTSDEVAGIRRTTGKRRGRNFIEHRSTDEEVVLHADVGPSVLIALIDPKPLTRESILKMLSASLPGHVTLIGASRFDGLRSHETSQLMGTQAEFNLVILYIRSAGVTDNWVQEQLQLIRTERPKMPVIKISDRTMPTM